MKGDKYRAGEAVCCENPVCCEIDLRTIPYIVYMYLMRRVILELPNSKFLRLFYYRYYK